MTDMEKIIASLEDAQRLIPELVAEIERLRLALHEVLVRWLDDADPDELPDVVQLARKALEK